MQTEIQLQGHVVNVTISDPALVELAQRMEPLTAEMELYFSCLIRKKVRFYEQRRSDDCVNVMENLDVQFRPVMTAVCGRDYEGDEPPLTDFPIAKPDAFVPHWLSIDFKHGEWLGEFGY